MSFLGEKARQYRAALIASFVFGLLAHGFAFTNKLLNHDEAASLFIKGATVTSGRWGLGLLDSIFPNYSMPWLYGLMTIGFLALSVCVLISLFQIKSSLLQVLAAGCVLTFPSLTGTFGYMFTSNSYALSFLLAVTAVWLVTRNHWFAKLFAIGLMVGSLSIYQSYISLAAGLLIVYLLWQLMYGEKAQIVFCRGILYVCFLLIGLSLYYAATQVVLRITGTAFSSYSEDSIAFQLSDLPQKIVLAYTMFGKFFTSHLHGLIPTPFSQLLHLGLVLVTLGLALAWGRFFRKENLPELLLGLLLLALLPLAVNVMYLITTEKSIHTLVLYGFVSVYFLPILLADRFFPECAGLCKLLRSISVNALMVLLALVILVNTYVANEAYLNLYLRYENAYSFYTSLASDIRSHPDFTPDTRLAVIGHYNDPQFYAEHFAHTDKITGVHGFIPDGYAKGQFLTYYIGFPIALAEDAELEAIQQTPEYQAMPCYPFHGFMRMFGNVLVIKLS